MDHYLLQASKLYEESCLKNNTTQMPRFAVPKTEEVKQQDRQGFLRKPKSTLDIAPQYGRP